MRTEATATIYLIESDKRSIYIGSTKKTPTARLKEHLADIRASRHTNQHFCRVVMKEGLNNIRVTVLETVPEHARFDREYFWIDQYLKDGAKLTNIVQKGHPYQSWYPARHKKILQNFVDFAYRFRRYDYKPDCDIPTVLYREAEMLRLIEKLFVKQIDGMFELYGTTQVLATKYVMTQVAAEPLKTLLCQRPEQPN